MPLYAYIKIPEIANSESLDAAYGKEWIPILSMGFSGKDSSAAKSKDSKGKKKDSAAKPNADHKHTSDPKHKGGPKHNIAPVQKTAKGAPHVLSKKPEAPKPSKDKDDSKSDSEDTDGLDRDEGLGELTITKTLDATSPKLQELCLKCIKKLKSDEYLVKGQIVLHICRPISEGGDDEGEENYGDSNIEVYLAYILDKCNLKSVKLDASESNKFTETVEIYFERIDSFVKDGGEWSHLCWDFADGKEATSTVKKNPEPPTPSG